MIYRTERDDAQQSFAGNPVVASVLRENVRVVDGRAIIGLWGGWPCLLSEIPAFGKVLAITRNFHAVVGNICDYRWQLWKRALRDGSTRWSFSI